MIKTGGLGIAPCSIPRRSMIAALASAEVIFHDQKRAIVHSSKQGEVFVWETVGFQDIEGRSVIHCVECVLDV